MGQDKKNYAGRGQRPRPLAPLYPIATPNFHCPL